MEGGLLWWSAAWASTLQVIGPSAFRAPDGITDAAATTAGALTLSPRGEIARFDRRGALLGTLQACPDRGPRLTFAAAARGDRVAVDCGDHTRVLALPGGEVLARVSAFTADVALSADGRSLAIVGERLEGDRSEDTSQLLIYDASTGALRVSFQGEQDRVEATRGGWVAARGALPGDPIELTGWVARGSSYGTWTHTVPPRLLRSGRHSAYTSVAVRDDGVTVCVAHDRGGTCLDALTGEEARPWTEADRAFTAPGDGRPIPGPAAGPQLSAASTHLHPLDRADDTWGAPRHVAASDDGATLAFVDDRGALWWGPRAAPRRLGGFTGPVVMAPDGRSLWHATRGGSTLRRADAQGRPLPALSHAAFQADGTLWGVDDRADPPTVQRFAPDAQTPATSWPLPRLFEVTGLQLVGDHLLVEHAQDEHWVVIDLRDGSLQAEGSHTYLAIDDLRLLPGGEVAQVTDDGRSRTLGTNRIPGRTWVRVLRDGGFASLADDGVRVALHRPDGSVRGAHDLPGRVASLHALADGVLAVLRDGRLAVVR